MKIVFEGKTQRGREILIRYPALGDLETMWTYINTLSKERTFVRLQGEEISFDEEKNYLQGLLKAIDHKKCVSLLVYSGRELIGVSDVKMGEKTEKHEGIFSVSIARHCRGEGIGRFLTAVTIEEAIHQIPDLEIVCLGLFANNLVGLDIYKRYGFLELGRLPRGAKFEDRYDDRIIMYKHVR